MTAAPSLRIAIEYPDGPDSARWVELTDDGSRGSKRVRAATLLDAQKRTATASDDVFVDLDVLVASSVSEAYDRYRRIRPGWQPGQPQARAWTVRANHDRRPGACRL